MSETNAPLPEKGKGTFLRPESFFGFLRLWIVYAGGVILTAYILMMVITPMLEN